MTKNYDADAFEKYWKEHKEDDFKFCDERTKKVYKMIARNAWMAALDSRENELKKINNELTDVKFELSLQKKWTLHHRRVSEIDAEKKYAAERELSILKEKYEKVDKEKPNKTITNPLASLQDIIAFDAKDWSVHNKDAWIYGIILGWDNASLKELKVKHGWTDEDVLKLKALHRNYRKLQNQISK